ncbi:hypothetical protein HDV63DRAFT_411366 [Trichoderma sp. SZMC 28014]
MFDESCISSVTSGIQPGGRALRQLKIWKLAYILKKPPVNFQLESAIREDAGELLGDLRLLLRAWSRLFDNLISDMADDSSLVSIRTLAESLHETLHRHWPCQLENHNHIGTLGECIGAGLQLEPRWIMNGNRDASFFFLLLTGSKYHQECKVHLSQASKQSICSIAYDDWHDYCLYLALDDHDRLWAYPEGVLKSQLQIEGDVGDEFMLLSLEDLFKCLEPTYAAKRVIDLIVARSLLLLLDGPWMAHYISLQNISVFCKMENGSPRPRFDKIFISTRFENGAGCRWQSLPKLLPHPFPEIEALGILMAEIELADDLNGIYECMNPEIKSARKLKLAEILLKECEKRMGLAEGVLQSIRFCIETKSLEKYRRNYSVDHNNDCYIQDHKGFIESYYDGIIRPLEKDLVEGAFWSWDEVSWRASRQLDDSEISKIIPVKVLPSTQCTCLRWQSLCSHSSRYVCISIDISIMGLLTQPRSASADQWFKMLEDTHTNLNRDRMDELSEDEIEGLVKIAILDTGVDLSHEAFKKFVENGQLDPGYDFVNRGEPMTDLEGHGTHCCHLVLKTAPYAKVYPLRVFRSSKREDATPELVKEALVYAIETLDVDIISMSFSFEEDEPAIKEALYYARPKSLRPVLMFAAASNNRALRTKPIGYPARVIDRVICVNSSTAQDEKSSFSPQGQPGWANISVIGENVHGAWLLNLLDENGPWKRMSGTSCSTPIVAGVAALILDFAKKDTPELNKFVTWNKRKAELWETSGMRIVLKRCMTEERSNGMYNFLKPWKLLNEPEQFIAARIEEALTSMYG